MRDAELERRWMKQLEGVAHIILAIDAGGGCKSLPGASLAEVRLLLPGEKRTDVLLVVKAREGDQKYVGFVGGPDLATALLTWRKKERGEGLQFREERPYSAPGGA